MADEPTIEPIETEKPEYFWTDDPDEVRRSFVFEFMADAEIDGSVLIKNMEAIFQWIKNGTLPESETKSRLRTVHK